jgi:hypothetical protein
MEKRTIVVLSIIVISFRLFPQSNDTSLQTVTQNSNVLALSQTQSNPVIDERTQIVGKRFMEYCQWYHQNVYPFAQEAEKNGIRATQEEISAQEKAFKALFPGIQSNPSIIYDEITARKYVKSIPGAFISSGDIQNAYTQLQSGSSNELLPPLADVQPMLEMRALLENSSVQNEIKKFNEQSEKKLNEVSIKANETWPISDLLIHSPANNCLAQYKDNDSCLLTVKQFNNYIQYMDVPKFISNDSAQTWAIREILRNFYIAGEARKKKHYRKRYHGRGKADLGARK